MVTAYRAITLPGLVRRTLPPLEMARAAIHSARKTPPARANHAAVR
jgi:hypothetical protein